MRNLILASRGRTRAINVSAGLLIKDSVEGHIAELNIHVSVNVLALTGLRLHNCRKLSLLVHRCRPGLALEKMWLIGYGLIANTDPSLTSAVDSGKPINIRSCWNHRFDVFKKLEWLLASSCTYFLCVYRIRARSRNLKAIICIDWHFALEYVAFFVDVHCIITTPE